MHNPIGKKLIHLLKLIKLIEIRSVFFGLHNPIIEYKASYERQ